MSEATIKEKLTSMNLPKLKKVKFKCHKCSEKDTEIEKLLGDNDLACIENGKLQASLLQASEGIRVLKQERDKVCEWKWNEEGYNDTSCGRKHAGAILGYCPHCGGKIKDGE